MNVTPPFNRNHSNLTTNTLGICFCLCSDKSNQIWGGIMGCKYRTDCFPSSGKTVYKNNIETTISIWQCNHIHTQLNAVIMAYNCNNLPFSSSPSLSIVANPKSDTFNTRSLSNRMFSGFKSRWTTLWLCRCSTAENNCLISTLCKSNEQMWIYSNITHR